MPIIKDLKLGDEGTLSCGCYILMWRRYRANGYNAAWRLRDPQTRIEHWVKALKRCTQNSCILSSAEVRLPIMWNARVDVDPLARALEVQFGSD